MKLLSLNIIFKSAKKNNKHIKTKKQKLSNKGKKKQLSLFLHFTQNVKTEYLVAFFRALVVHKW